MQNKKTRNQNKTTKPHETTRNQFNDFALFGAVLWFPANNFADFYSVAFALIVKIFC